MLFFILIIYFLDYTVLNATFAEFGAGKSFSHMKAEEWYRFFTGVFLHDNLLHLIANCIALYAVGNILEKKVKSYWFLFVFYFGHLMANIILAGFANYSSNNGASAGIYSLIAFIVVLYLRNPVNIELSANRISVICLMLYAILSIFYGWFTATIHSVAFAWGIAVSLFLIISRMPIGKSFTSSMNKIKPQKL